MIWSSVLPVHYLPLKNPLSSVVRAECLHPYNIDKLPVHENNKTRQTIFLVLVLHFVHKILIMV